MKNGLRARITAGAAAIALAAGLSVTGATAANAWSNPQEWGNGANCPGGYTGHKATPLQVSPNNKYVVSVFSYTGKSYNRCIIAVKQGPFYGKASLMTLRVNKGARKEVIDSGLFKYQTNALLGKVDSNDTWYFEGYTADYTKRVWMNSMF